jgi:hypothetical protein
MVGTENTSAERKRKSRANLSCDIVTTESQKCHKNVTTEYRDKSLEFRDKSIENRDESAEQRDTIDYQRVADMYNDTCVSFPRLSKLSDSRKKCIRARVNGGYTYEDFQRLFAKAEQSSFLKGGNERNWFATFDWLIKDGNMAKVLDGNYDGGTKNGTFNGTNEQVYGIII